VNNNKRRLIAITMAILPTLAALGGWGAAQERVASLSLERRTASVAITAGKTQDVRVDAPFTDVMVGDPDVADVTPLTDHSLSILGKKIGMTRVSVYGEGKRMVGLFDMTVASIRGQIAAAIRIIVQLQRLSDGKRKLTSIAEITGLEGDIIQMQEIFKFVRTGTAPDNSVIGHFQATGVRPRFLADLTAMGIKIPGSYFDPSQPL
jgi:Flp pilus assembly secretin CpaC